MLKLVAFCYCQTPMPAVSPKYTGLENEAAEAFLTDRDPAKLLEARTELVDDFVVRATETHLNAKTPVNFAVLAVGGYGRREIFPASDVDLLVLVEKESEFESIREPLSEFLRTLWDAKVRVGHSVRTVAECGRLHDQNIEFHISLLDHRLVSGREELYGEFSRTVREFFAHHGHTVTGRLVEMARHRHEKFNNTIYHLEPNVKECPGGVRDAHTLRWLAQLLPHEAIRSSVADLEASLQFLFQLRCLLHIRLGRDNNLLTFDLQDDAARSLPDEPISAEEWMRLYFRHVRPIYQRCKRSLDHAEEQDSTLLRQFKDRRNRFSTAEFTVSRDRIFLRNASETLNSTEAIIRLFTLVGRHGIRLSWDAQRRIQAEREHLAAIFREHPPVWPEWRELLSQPQAALALHAMQETGLLATVIPEWTYIDSLVVRDFYHRYTVDEHTLIAIEVFDGLVANNPGTPPRFHKFALLENEPATLRFAMLLHDLGKGLTPGDHVRGSLAGATDILERVNAPQNVRDAVLFLIGHHLDLSLIMNGRDLEDPATARYLTSRVETQEDLLRLTLLTYADVSAVNPTAMTPWREEQLWRVYSMGLDQLTRELATDRIHEAANLHSSKLASPGLVRFVEGFPKRYLRIHSRQEIERHLALEQKSRREGVAISIDREAGAYSLTVLAHDEPGLFASLCGALASFGMNIVKAEAASNDSGCILDLIRFVDPHRTFDLNPEEINRLQWTIECVVRRSVEVRDLLKRRRPAARSHSESSIVPVVRFDNDASDSSTLIDFVGEDRPGLLYELASAINAQNCNIEVVMIDTEGHKAIDTFYLTHAGGKLDDSKQIQLKADLIRAGGQAASFS